MKAFLYLEKNYLSTSLLNYKQQHNGKLLVKVPPQYTSKTCYGCGNINPKLKLNHRQYWCLECGYIEHRDINAANNILSKGLSFLGQEISMQTLKNKAFR
nr:transposase [Helicobacter pylori]